MLSIQEYNHKLKSLKNTQKITRTMKMVSASKLRKAHKAQSDAKLYAHNVAALICRIAISVDSHLHPLLQPREKVNKVLILIITSDKGLCGAFNHNANRQVHAWIEKNRHKYEAIDISCCGRRGHSFFRKAENIKKYYEGVTNDPQFSHAHAIGDDLSQDFLAGEYSEIYLSYNQFFSPLSQKTVFEKILPIDPHALAKEKVESKGDYIFEPTQSRLLNFLIPHFLYFKIYFALLENAAGEHGARMSAMDNATKNASDLLDQYTLLRNRARQSAITTELSEIVAGAEALR